MAMCINGIELQAIIKNASLARFVLSLLLLLLTEQAEASRLGGGIIKTKGWQHPSPPARSRAKYHKPVNHGKFLPGAWSSAHATFYGAPDGSDTTAGACGYYDTVSQGYGLQTAAVSTSVFDGGAACGACFEIRCRSSGQARQYGWCKPGQPSVTVTATNFCPPNYALSSDNGGWCNPPRVHFDLAVPAFLQMAERRAGIVPVAYRRVPCERRGGIRFTITGNRYYNLVLVWNVAGAGDVKGVQVKGDDGGLPSWTRMTRNWGQNWETDKDLTGQSLSFRVEGGDRRKSTSWDVAPRSWRFGQTFQGKNFRF